MSNRRKYYLLFTASLIALACHSQDWSIVLKAGRVYNKYKFKDDGQGFKNPKSINYSLDAQVLVQRTVGKHWYFQTGMTYLEYDQYISTRLYKAPWQLRNPALTVPFNAGCRAKKGRVGFYVAAGPSIGFLLDPIYGNFIAMELTPQGMIDSAARGRIIRNENPTFLLFGGQAGLSFTLSSKISLELGLTGAKGISQITEFDFYYNDGNGRNDQHARQWGKGDYLGALLGFRYHFIGKGNRE